MLDDDELRRDIYDDIDDDMLRLLFDAYSDLPRITSKIY